MAQRNVVALLVSVIALTQASISRPSPGSKLVLHSCVDTSGQCYYVNPVGYPNKEVVKSSYTSPIPLAWTVGANGTVFLEIAKLSDQDQLFNYSNGNFVSMASGLCVSFGRLEVGSALGLAPCNASEGEKFVYNATDDGHIVAGYTGSGLCVDAM